MSWWTVAALISCTIVLSIEVDEYEYESGSGGYYEYDYLSLDENDVPSGDYYADYEEEERHSYMDAELEYIPEISTKPQNINIKPKETAIFPCEAADSEKFVRMWLKDGDMLYTGTIRLTVDSRFSLDEDNTSLILENSGVEDSGLYECRIMVREELSVKHKLTVTDTLTIQSDPMEGVLTVPLQGSAEFGCRVDGDEGYNNISWSRDSTKFRDGEYTKVGQRIKFENTSLNDAGYYYCTVTDDDGQIKAASVHLKVLSPPGIVDLRKTTLQSGNGFGMEISCIVTGDPTPTVLWYRNGETIVETGKLSSERAGTRNVLVIKNFQRSDTGKYMCYARNSMGSTQETVEVLHEDIENVDIQIHTQIHSQGLNTGDLLKLEKELLSLKSVMDQEQEKSIMFQRKMNQEIELVKMNRGSSNRTVSMGSQDSYEQAILADVDRVENEVRNQKLMFRDVRTEMETNKHISQEDRERLWDTVYELQEVTNITTRNIEDIYDKDILRLHNFQNSVEAELSKLKMEISGMFQDRNSPGSSVALTGDFNDLQGALFKVEKDVESLRSLHQISSIAQRSLRTDMNMVFRDIDTLKKEKQENVKDVERLKRFVNQLEVEKIDENSAKIQGLINLLSHLENDVDKTAEKMRKVSKQTTDIEKMNILVLEVQKLKNQMYFLQQSFIQIRTQEHLADTGSGMIQDNRKSPKLARFQTQLELLSGQLAELIELDCVPRNQFNNKIRGITELMETQNEEIGDWRQRFQRLEEENRDTKSQFTSILNQLHKMRLEMERSEEEKRKYYLLLYGFKKKRKLERPQQIVGMVANFLRSGLQLQDLQVEEAVRVEDSARGRPVRVKFSSLRDRNLVLSTSRRTKTKIRVVEDYTDSVKRRRDKLAEFARKHSSATRSSWALKEDKLYFNKKIYVYNETTAEITAVQNIV